MAQIVGFVLIFLNVKEMALTEFSTVFLFILVQILVYIFGFMNYAFKVILICALNVLICPLTCTKG